MSWDDEDESVNPEQQRSNELLNEQITQNKLELDQKRQALSAEKLKIIKSMGGQDWHSPRTSPSQPENVAKSPLPKFGMGKWLPGMSRQG